MDQNPDSAQTPVPQEDEAASNSDSPFPAAPAKPASDSPFPAPTASTLGATTPDSTPATATNTPVAQAPVNPVSVAPMTPLSSGPETLNASKVSFFLGISTLFFGFFTGIPAVIFGHKAHKRILASGGKTPGYGMALAGLVLGYISIALIPLIMSMGIIAAVAIPNIARIDEAASSAKNQRNAQNITSVYMASLAAGAQYDDLNGDSTLDLDEIIEQVREGKIIEGGPFHGTNFQVPNLLEADAEASKPFLQVGPGGELVFVAPDRGGY